MASAEIVRVTRLPAADLKRPGKFDLIISYKLDDGQTGVVSVPDEGHTDAAISSAIREHVKSLGALQGRKLAL